MFPSNKLSKSNKLILFCSNTVRKLSFDRRWQFLLCFRINSASRIRYKISLPEKSQALFGKVSTNVYEDPLVSGTYCFSNRGREKLLCTKLVEGKPRSMKIYSLAYLQTDSSTQMTSIFCISHSKVFLHVLISNDGLKWNQTTDTQAVLNK